MSYSKIIGDFSTKTLYFCLFSVVMSVFTIAFILSPLGSSMIGHLIIIASIIGLIYYNTTHTFDFVDKLKINLWQKNESWNPLETNVIFNYLLNFCLIFLAYSVLKRMIY